MLVQAASSCEKRGTAGETGVSCGKETGESGRKNNPAAPPNLWVRNGIGRGKRKKSAA